MSRPQGHGTVGMNLSLKNPVTPPGIDVGTVRPVAQRLNHYATPVPMPHILIQEKQGKDDDDDDDGGGGGGGR